MRIYYRGYVINGDNGSAFCAVYGARPERQHLTSQADSISAMKWIDSDVTRRLVHSYGWERRQHPLF